MTLTLTAKLLRDLRWNLLAVALLLGLFQVFWYKITDRIIGELSPFFTALAGRSGLEREDVEAVVFNGPGKIARTIIGGERINLDRVMDMLSIGYVHPLMVTLFCIWGVGRASGAVAGELDRGTMELLLSQPLARFRVLLAHLLVDGVTIPLLCLSLWAGNAIGYAAIGPIRLRPVEGELKKPLPAPKLAIDVLGRTVFEARLESALPERSPEEVAALTRERLAVSLADFGPGLVVVGGLIFAVTGYTLVLSALGRYRLRVLGVAVLLTLLMFMVNVLGQMWDTVDFLRPLTIFYYYQPQQAILGLGWSVPVWGLNVPMLAVLYGVGAAGYGAALWIFSRRDLPAPL